MTFISTISEFKIKKVNTNIHKAKITTSSDMAEYIRNIYDKEEIPVFESFYVVFLNRANNTTGYAKISQGGLHGTVVDLRLIAKYAVDGLATSVILVHNHPSGNIYPSDADKIVTKKAVDGLKLLDITVLDHVILTENSYYSFADNNLI